jgi:hypothetical protein
MNPTEFIRKWSKADLSERAGSHDHFNDLCDLLGQDRPSVADPKGEWFTFEKRAAKQSGGEGWADVWKKGCFAWEYKSKGKDLKAAYNQLLQYRQALESPPLLVVCDIDTTEIHTDFTNTPTQVYTVPLLEMDKPRNLQILRNVFSDPDKLKPSRTRDEVTKDAAERVAEIAQRMRDRGLAPHDVARFLDRIVFCLFAEDIGLLPAKLFGGLVDKTRGDPKAFTDAVRELFTAMSKGGRFWGNPIKHFNGDLFEDSPVLMMTDEEIERVYEACKEEWDAVDPSIFGTLFERGLDPDKRAQIGAHYTSREDIETLVEPVVMWPLRREWEEVRQTAENLLTTGRKDAGPAGAESAPRKPLTKAQSTKASDEADHMVQRFHARLTQVTVLDPACGSGNFLYVTLQKLKDLEKAVIVFAAQNGLGEIAPLVGPHQLFGIEINPYAYELAQMVVWIGYIQWMRANGFAIDRDPVLQPMAGNFQNKDAILDLSDPQHPKEPDWPKVDCIVGNPPFLGGNKIRQGLGNDYVDKLFALYDGRVPAFADLCCYWFERARAQIQGGRCERAGLLGTQGIRGGANRQVLERIKRTGDIYFAESDRQWVLDGAAVHVSMVGYDAGEELVRVLDGQLAGAINADLTSRVDVTRAQAQRQNTDTCYMGPSAKGPFDIAEATALDMLCCAPNAHGRPNSDVIRCVNSAIDLTGNSRNVWTVDFGVLPREAAARYEAPFEYVRREVYPVRSRNRRKAYADRWWQYAEPRPGIREHFAGLARFLATPGVAKYRLFLWKTPEVLCNQGTLVFARSDDYFFGALHSRLHEVWARAQGTQLRERESGFRYTPTTCFETFPFPWPPGKEPKDDPLVRAIADAARELNELRENWLNPPEWTRVEVLEFAGSTTGPWARYVHEPDDRGIGTVRYERRVDNGVMPTQLKQRTLTNLYNQQPTWLADAHAKLDAAVCAAYAAATGDAAWRPDMGDEEILEKLLALNLQRAQRKAS